MKSPWDLLNQARTTLQVQLPGRVSAFNAEAGHNVQLAAPVAYYLAQVSGSTLIAGGFPAVEMWIPTEQLGPFEVARARGNLDATIVVVCSIESSDGEREPLYETIVGLSRCLLETLLPPHAFGAGVEVAQRPGAVRVDYGMGPLNPSPHGDERTSDRWRTSCVITVALEDDTAIP